jgi:hypothetical protein
MNTENIIALADLIETLPQAGFGSREGFFMGNWRHDCGTPSCIAGWAVHLAGIDCSRSQVADKAADWLDLYFEDEAQDLFEPSHLPYEAITPQHAAKVLRHLAETGVVDWSRS